jgi:TPR repeat protein
LLSDCDIRRAVLALAFSVALVLTIPAAAFGGSLEAGLAAYDNGDYAAATQDLVPLAQAGNPDALLAIGSMYAKGQGVSYDYARALELFGRAYAAGSYDALAEMGNMYRNGFGVEQSYAKAVTMFQESMQHGSLRGESYLGEAYASGQGVPTDYQQALSLFQDAGGKGLASALVNLGNLYLSGRGVPKDTTSAARYYAAAIEKNSPQAMNNLGLMWQKGLGVTQDRAGALKLFERAGMLGESSGAYNAGWAYENGIGTAKDLVLAYKWYDIGANEGGTFSARRRDLVSIQLTADQIQQAKQLEPSYGSANGASASAQQPEGSAQQSEALGSFRDGGDAYDRGDYASALRIWRPLADRDDAAAQVMVGVMYDLGRGVTQDYVAAATWYRKAADQGYAPGQYGIASMYESGLGVQQDYEIAITWYRRAADQSFAPAQYRLGFLYETGRGVRLDYAEAYKWYNLAAANFPPSDATERAQAIKDRDRVGAILAAAQAAPPAPTSSQKVLKITSAGSGFYVSNAALLLTNDHVVDGCSAVTISGEAASVLHVDSQNDLALLSAQPRSGDVASLRVSPAVRSGERVVVVGFPLPGILAEQANVTTGDVSSLAGPKNDSRYLQITAPVQPGNSGGPLFDLSGNVIGVVSAKLNAIKVAGVTGDIPENVNFALNVSVVRGFLDSQGIAYQTSDSAAERSAADIGDVGKNITRRVECWQ